MIEILLLAIIIGAVFAIAYYYSAAYLRRQPTMAGATSTINGVTKFRHNSAPNKKAVERAVIVVKNDTNAKHGYTDIRGVEIMIPPGGKFTSVVPLKVAHRMQQTGKLTVTRLTPL